MNLKRSIKYYWLKIVRLKGSPHDLALGIAIGIFVGMLPIMPFQIALAVTLALFFKGSKITAALGTWVSNPLNWYFLYYFSYKIGAVILGLSEKNRGFSSVMGSIQSLNHGEGFSVVMGEIAGVGSAIIVAFLLGGLILGLIVAPPAYFIFLKVFHFISAWREKRKSHKHWKKLIQ